MENRDYFSELSALFPADFSQINQIISRILACVERGNSLWIIGNGGSASTADHFEVDMSFVRLTEQTKKIKAKSLCSNNSVLTAIGNDIGFENIFAHQLKRQGLPGDICLAISASGNSMNLVRAFEECDTIGIEKIALLGFDGGVLSTKAHVFSLISCEKGKYGPVEDAHLAICHFMAAELKKHLFEVEK